MKKNGPEVAGICFIVGAFVVAIICGIVFQIPTAEYLEYLDSPYSQSYSYSYRQFTGSQADFNWTLSFYVFTSGAILSSVFFAFSAVVKRQNMMISLLRGDEGKR